MPSLRRPDRGRHSPAGCRQRLCAGSRAAARISGVSKVLVADAAALRRAVAREPRRTGGGQCRRLFSPAGCGDHQRQELHATRRRLLDVAQISEIIAVESPIPSVRPIYAGNVVATVQSADPIKVITCARPLSKRQAREAAPVSRSLLPVPTGQSRLIGRELTKSERPELTAAKVIVSGGRGMGSGENFHKLLEPLADRLAAAVGHRARRSMPVMHRTTIRWGRRARS
jgi:electron transfer flavoprotein alpha subunit